LNELLKAPVLILGILVRGSFRSSRFIAGEIMPVLVFNFGSSFGLKAVPVEIGEIKFCGEFTLESDIFSLFYDVLSSSVLI
jgi:hypothetical protein